MLQNGTIPPNSTSRVGLNEFFTGEVLCLQIFIGGAVTAGSVRPEDRLLGITRELGPSCRNYGRGGVLPRSAPKSAPCALPTDDA